VSTRRDDSGQALIETLVVGLILIVPVIWLLSVLSDMHRAALATTAAVREAGFEAARSSSVRSADRAVAIAVGQAYADQGLAAVPAEVEWSAPGFQRGGDVEVSVAYPVSVMRFPFIGFSGGPRVWVRARHVTRIDPFMSRP
jgi:hypothetical protein